MTAGNPYVAWFDHIGADDIAKVGGKNASLGEMIQTLKDQDISVPGGFATTSEAYWEFIETNELREKIRGCLEEMEEGEKTLWRSEAALRRRICPRPVLPDSRRQDNTIINGGRC